jgi:hypothetical protein
VSLNLARVEEVQGIVEACLYKYMDYGMVVEASEEITDALWEHLKEDD